MAHRIGASRYPCARPLVEALLRSEPECELIEGLPSEIDHQLREGDLHGAFVSPLAYATEHRELRIVPGIGVVSERDSGGIVLLLNRDTHNILRLAADPESVSEIALARIVLAEKYESTPNLVPLDKPPVEMLATADAVLLSGAGVRLIEEGPARLDLVDEWYDIAELPFVHEFLAFREHAATTSFVRSLQKSARSQSELPPGGDPEEEECLMFRMELDDDAIRGMEEFLRMCFYHGFIGDVPELRFLGTGAAGK